MAKKKSNLRQIVFFILYSITLLTPMILLGLVLIGHSMAYDNKLISLDTFVIASSVIMTGMALIQFMFIKSMINGVKL